MIKVVVTENGQVLDELEFNESNIMRPEGAVAVIHRDIMKHCTRVGLWYRVAHAAAWIAETASMLDALEEQKRRQKGKSNEGPHDDG